MNGLLEIVVADAGGAEQAAVGGAGVAQLDDVGSHDEESSREWKYANRSIVSGSGVAVECVGLVQCRGSYGSGDGDSPILTLEHAKWDRPATPEPTVPTPLAASPCIAAILSPHATQIPLLRSRQGAGRLQRRADVPADRARWRALPPSRCRRPSSAAGCMRQYEARPALQPRVLRGLLPRDRHPARLRRPGRGRRDIFTSEPADAARGGPAPPGRLPRWASSRTPARATGSTASAATASWPRCFSVLRPELPDRRVQAGRRHLPRRRRIGRLPAGGDLLRRRPRRARGRARAVGFDAVQFTSAEALAKSWGSGRAVQLLSGPCFSTTWTLACGVFSQQLTVSGTFRSNVTNHGLRGLSGDATGIVDIHEASLDNQFPAMHFRLSIVLTDSAPNPKWRQHHNDDEFFQSPPPLGPMFVHIQRDTSMHAHWSWNTTFHTGKFLTEVRHCSYCCLECGPQFQHRSLGIRRITATVRSTKRTAVRFAGQGQRTSLPACGGGNPKPLTTKTVDAKRAFHLPCSSDPEKAQRI